MLEKDIVNDNAHVDDHEDLVVNGDMNRPISREEVLFALRKLKNRKAPGPDKIIGEMYKHSNEQVVDFFMKFFNVLFDNGIFP